MKKLIKYVFFLLFVYISVIMLGCGIQKKIIFQPTKLSSDFKFRSEFNFEEVFLSTSDGNKINGLFFPDSSNKVILYFHGNAGSLDSWQFVYNSFRSLGYNFFIIDYRGYGKSSGKITEEGLYIDAQTAYNYLLNRGFKDNQIVVYGRSIGTGMAVNLACKNKINSLILETPFTNLRKLASEKYPYLLPSLYLKFEFNNELKLKQIKSPLLIIHGKNDNVVPFKDGEKLFNDYQGKKEFLSIENGQHNNLSTFPEFSQGILIFLFELDKERD
jgi:uncharacterized protein